MSGIHLPLQRDTSGRLNYTDEQGDVHLDVHAVRAYPISAPDEGISLLGSDGHELLWIAHLEQLSPPSRELISAELASREFMPVISVIRSVSSFATPSVWSVATDRGDTDFTLKGEDQIRRLNHTALLITDSLGISYRIADVGKLDRHSRKLLDRFL